MTINLTQDPRYSALSSDEGKNELEVYLQWISDNNLADTQKSFVDFSVGRASLDGGRHLFVIWKKIMAPMKVDLKTTLENMRFFLNPNEDSFCIRDAAGWFDFLPQVYEVMSEVPVPVIPRPSFKLIGVPVAFAK